MPSLLKYAKGRLETRDLLRKVSDHTLLSKAKLLNIKRLARLMNTQHVEGDFVECGTYKGGSAAVIASELNQDRHLWLYDSFEGLPEVREIDGEAAREAVGACRADEADVVEALAKLEIPSSLYSIRKGWFSETFQGTLPNRVALLHCDADWYDSVSIVLETFYPLIPLGGCVILDDFGWWEGCRIAFYDFCQMHQERPLIERVGADQAYWIKGQEHNRG